MPKIIFPVDHRPGLRASEGAGRLINCYAESIGEGGRAVSVRHRSAGLVNFGTTGEDGCRGFIEVAGVLYVAFDEELVKFTSAGGASASVGTLAGDKKGFFARNNAATPDKVFVDPDGNIATFTPSAVTSGFDADLPAVNSTDGLDGYILFTTGSGEIWATGLNVVTVDPLSFVKDQESGGLYRGVTFGGRYYALGRKSTGIYINAATSPFPLARSDVIPRGIAGPYCVTGHESNFNKGLHIVADDNTVCRIDGNQTVKISSPDLDALIEAVSDKTTLEMCSYISRGHSFIQITCPAWTWVCNLDAGNKWHQRRSYLLQNSRITQTYYAFGKWLCGDSETGNVQQITATSHQEIGDPLICEVWSAPLQSFPQRVRGASAFLDFAMGVGEAEGADPIETDPGVEVTYSTDGGQTFSIPRTRKLGRQSIGENRVRVNQVKAAGRQGYIWKIVMSDPVHFGLMGGEMIGEPRAP